MHEQNSNEGTTIKNRQKWNTGKSIKHSMQTYLMYNT
jgi:hypothetical protein